MQKYKNLLSIDKIIILVLGAVSILTFLQPSFFNLLSSQTHLVRFLTNLYWSVPSVFFVTFITYCLFKTLPFASKKNLLFAIFGCLILLTSVPYFSNISTFKEVSLLTNDDHDHLKKPPNFEAIAFNKIIRVPAYKGPSKMQAVTDCDWICLYILYSGSANKVLMLHNDNPYISLKQSSVATAYNLKKQSKCPKIKLPLSTNEYQARLPAINSRTGKNVNFKEVANEKNKNGICLIAEKTTLAEADIVFSNIVLKRGTNILKTGFSITANTITADRISIHVPQLSDNNFAEVYRQTGVYYRPLSPVLLPIPMFGYMDTYLRPRDIGFIGKGWMRIPKYINHPNAFENQLNWRGVIEDEMLIKFDYDKIDHS